MTISSQHSMGGDYTETIELPSEVEPSEYPITMLSANLVNVLSRLPKKGTFMHIPTTATGGDIRFNAGNHWMLLGRVVVR